MELVTQAEARRIARTLLLLRDLHERTPEQAYEASSHDAMNIGRFCEAVSVAEDVLFNVLNTAASRCRDKHAAEALDAREATL